MVLGREGVGKTHILHRLRGLDYRNLSTNGISINEFSMGDLRLTWFDFGGQEVFYPTHQFFLTSNCVYLVVFRLDDPNYIERVQHWLQTITEFGRARRGAKRPIKICLVATCADLVRSKEQQDAIWSRLDSCLINNPDVVRKVA
jgi:GTPase SAR1 family protein